MVPRLKAKIKSYQVVVGAETGALAVILMLIGFGVLAIGPAAGGCCTVTLRAGVDADFAATIDDLPSDLYVGGLNLYTIIIDPWVYDLIISQGLSSNAEFVEYMDANYPDTVISSFAFIDVFVADARFIADEDYSNMSTVGLSESICLPGTLFCPYMAVYVYYENGTLYGEYTVYVFDPELPEFEEMSYGDMVNMTSMMPDQYVIDCGETLSINVLSLSIDSGTGDATFELEVNGDTFATEGNVPPS